MRTHFQQDALPRFQYLPFVFVDINDLRMRINLQHPGCFRLAAIGVKMFFLLNVWRPIVPVLFCWPHPGLRRRVGMDRLYKRSKFQLNRMRNRRVIRGQNIRPSIPTLDSKFEPNLIDTDQDKIGARRKVWTKDSLGPSAQKFLSPHFRVMAPENLYAREEPLMSTNVKGSQGTRGCCRRKNVYLLNFWRPIVHVLFQWPHPGLCRLVCCMDGLYKRSKFQLYRMKSRRDIRGQQNSTGTMRLQIYAHEQIINVYKRKG